MSTFLPKNRTSFYTRITIPKALQVYFHKRVEVWKSLQTKDNEEASCRSLKWEAEAKRLFRTLRQYGKRMTKDQIETLVSDWLESELEKSEEWRNSYGPISQNVRATAPVFLEGNLDDAKEALATNNFRVVENEADDLLKSAGLPALDHESAEYGRLCRRLLRAKIEYAKIQIDRWNGEYHDNHLSRSVVNNQKPKTAPQPSKPSPLFSVALEKYLAGNPRPARTAKPLKAEFLRIIQTVGGDRPIASITRADGVAYKESLLQVRKVSVSTCIKHLSNADAFFKWAEVHAYAPEGSNPMKGLAPSKRQAKKQSLKR